MKSLRLRITIWFGVSLFAVVGVFVAVTHRHLERELRSEKWERVERGPARAAERDSGDGGDRRERDEDRHGESLHGSYSEAEVHDIIGELWRAAFLYAGPTLAVSLAVGFFLARRAFAPVSEMRRQLQSITARSLGKRVRVADADRELQTIESEINALLVRLETTFAQLTEYSAQVAHELRTPLTLLRLQVEDAAGRIEPALAESLQEELARLSEYVEQSLLLATAEQGRLPGKPETVNLRVLLAEMLEAFVLLARSERREVRLCVEPDLEPLVRADPRHLRQMLHNLLANAVRHGCGDIVVSLSGSDGADGRADGVRCRIENLCLADAAEKRGNGLGLRIVRALATTQEIGFNAGKSDGEGFVAELALPAARAP